MTGIDLILVGHTPMEVPHWTRRNVLCIDTGLYVEPGGHLTVAEVQTGAPTLRPVQTGRVNAMREEADIPPGA